MNPRWSPLLIPRRPVPTYLDLATWKRRPQFDFFRTFDNPFFNVCVEVDVTQLRAWATARGVSFFFASLYASQRAAHATPPFRYRIWGERVRVHERMMAGATVLRDDDTFGFGYFDPAPTIERFVENGRPVLEQVRAGDTLDPRDDVDDVIHYSVLPWLSFTSFSHARNWGTDDSVPKIVFGKFATETGRTLMPVSVEVHHALMDGLHVGRYVERLQALCQAPDRLSEPMD